MSVLDGDLHQPVPGGIAPRASAKRFDGPAITVRSLAKRYRRRRVLIDVSFGIPRAMLIGIEGENGAGKSTLLKCLVGLLKQDAGEVAVRGTVGYCPQEPLLMESLTVLEHLRFFGAGYGLHPDRSALRSAELMETFNCAKFAGTRIDRLSGGTRQKVN